MTTGVHGPTRARIEAKTLRTDRWWLYPLTVFVVFLSFIVYATVRAFQGAYYYSEPYLSPFYSPCLGDCVKGSSDFGQPFGLLRAPILGPPRRMPVMPLNLVQQAIWRRYHNTVKSRFVSSLSSTPVRRTPLI